MCGESAERDSAGGEDPAGAAGGSAALHTPNVALGRPENNLPVILQLLEWIILDLGR